MAFLSLWKQTANFHPGIPNNSNRASLHFCGLLPDDVLSSIGKHYAHGETWHCQTLLWHPWGSSLPAQMMVFGITVVFKDAMHCGLGSGSPAQDLESFTTSDVSLGSSGTLQPYAKGWR